MYVGALNRNQTAVRDILAQHDLLILLGADQLTMSVWSETEAIPPAMPIVQIGQRDWELGKNYPCEMAIRADLKETLIALDPQLSRLMNDQQARTVADRAAAIKDDNWSSRRAQLVRLVDAEPSSSLIDPRQLMSAIARHVRPETIVVDEGLTTTTSLLQFLPFRDRASYFGLASGGIGFAVAGAIGISLAKPDRPVLAIIGDGSAMYNIQALWTAAHLKLPIVYLICNNESYHILKQRVQAYHGNPRIDFVTLATSMGVDAARINTLEQLDEHLGEMHDSANGPRLLDVRVSDSFDS